MESQQSLRENQSIFARMGLKRGAKRTIMCSFQSPQKKAKKGEGSSSRGRSGRERFGSQSLCERCLEGERLLFLEESLQEVPAGRERLWACIDEIANAKREKMQARREGAGGWPQTVARSS